MQFKINFTNNIKLTYDLVNHEIVDSWSKLITAQSVNNICPYNHYIGYASDAMLAQRINRLYELADIINTNTPEHVIKTEIRKDNYHEAINTMHVHFPLLKNDENYKHIWDILTEYNDAIHWIESTIQNKWSGIKLLESRLFRITLDFNKSTSLFNNIPDSAFSLFDPETLFGELKIHYTHVGRHAQELFLANDLVCPQDQFVPQRLYAASVRMYFTEDYRIDRNKWKLFYNQRGKTFWKLDIDDPKLAFGYIKIGQLSNIEIDNVNIEIPLTLKDRHEFRQKLASTQVIDWYII